MTQEHEINMFITTYCNGSTKEGHAQINMVYGPHTKTMGTRATNTTDNAMALHAAITAFKALKKKGLNISVFISSTYVVNAFNKGWVDTWSTNGWKKSNKKPVENKELWVELFKLVEDHAVEWHVGTK